MNILTQTCLGRLTYINSQKTPLLTRIMEEQAKKESEILRDIEYGKMTYMVDNTGSLIDENYPKRKLMEKFKGSVERCLIERRKRNTPKNKGVGSIFDAKVLKRETKKHLNLSSIKSALEKYSEELGEDPIVILSPVDYNLLLKKLPEEEKEELREEKGLTYIKSLPLSASLYQSPYMQEATAVILNPKDFYFSLNEFEFGRFTIGERLKVEVAVGTKGGTVVELRERRKIRKLISDKIKETIDP